MDCLAATLLVASYLLKCYSDTELQSVIVNIVISWLGVEQLTLLIKLIRAIGRCDNSKGAIVYIGGSSGVGETANLLH